MGDTEPTFSPGKLLVCVGLCVSRDGTGSRHQTRCARGAVHLARWWAATTFLESPSVPIWVRQLRPGN